jgi:hypothetical protein
VSAPECLKRAAWGTCLEGLADGWHGAPDLCPACTRALMTALDGIAGPMVWHSAYLTRATNTADATND